MKGQLIPIALNFLASIIGAFGQYLYKLGAKDMKEIPLYRNIPFLGGVALFCLVMALFMISFRLGGRISVTFPVYALTFVWGTLIGVLIDKEPFNQVQLFGVVLVVVGVAIVGSMATR